MRRVALTAIFVVLLAAIPAAAQAPVFNLPLKAKLSDCHTGPLSTDRFAAFVGQMPALQGTRRMWMRFDLYERLPGANWKHVDVAKFGTWQKSDPGKPGFIYLKRVDQLAAPAAYRTVVRFRWYDKHGKLQRSARRTSPTCRQPDPRPDLTVGKVTASEAGQGRLRYVISVRDAGLSDAGAFDSVLSVDGTPQPAATVAGLAAGSTTKVAIVGQRCELGTQLKIALDTGHTVDEANEANNTVRRPCPMP